MALPNPPLNPNAAIPNNPFYSPYFNFLQGEYGPFIIGSGLSLSASGVLTATGGGGGGAVTSISSSGLGIGVSSPTGNVILSNTGVTRINAGAGVSISGNIGDVTITATNLGTVNDIIPGAGLTGGGPGPTVSLSLSNTGVGPGTYSFASFTVDSYGRITSAANGTPVASLTGSSPIVISGGATTPVVSVNTASTSSLGVVQLSDSVSTASSATAATSLAVKQAYDAAITSVSASLFTTKGQVLVSSAPSTAAVLSSGGAGQALVVDSSTLTGFSWAPVTNCTGTVTSITTGTGLAGGPVTTSGSISLSNTAVTPGFYSNASFTVDSQGRLTTASSGVNPVVSVTGSAPIQVTAGVTPTVSITASSLTASGAVQLYNDTNNTSTALALTAAQGKVLQDQITALSTAGSLELAGTLDANASVLVSVTSVGTAASYAVGSSLPVASVTTNNTYVIVTTPGTVTPPGGVATVATRGDWFLVTQTSPGVYAWEFLNVGFDAPYATTTTSGVVCLSTNALAQAGVDTLTALTPATAASAYVPLSAYTAKGRILVATSASTPVALPVGTNGQVLAANSTCVTGLEWVAGAFIPCSCITGKGALVSGTAANTPTALSVGTNGQVLYVNSACPSGLCWGTPPVTNLDFTAKGQLLAGTASNAFTQFGVGANGQVLIACAASSTGLCWGNPTALIDAATTITAGILCLATNALTIAGTNTTTAVTPAAFCAAAQCYVPKSLFTAKGAIAAATGTNTPATLALGVNGQILTVNSACSAGLEWVAGSFIPCSCITGKGALITGTAADTPVALTVGTDGQVLFACSAASDGLCWADMTPATPTLGGVMYGCTTPLIPLISTGDVALGLNAYRSCTTGSANVAIGGSALCNLTTANNNVAVGTRSALGITTTSNNVVVGNYAAECAANLTSSTVIGQGAHYCNLGDCCNVIIGYDANNNLGGTTGISCIARSVVVGASALTNFDYSASNLVVIGTGVELASPTTSTQLAIGNGTNFWLTGNSTYAIKPGAGIIDCTNSCGSAGQVLMSNGSNAICWGSASGSAATPTVSGTVLGLTTASNTSLGCSSLGGLTSGTLNVAVGVCAGCAITTGSQNVVVGPNVAVASSTGSCQLAIGYSATCNWLTGDSNKNIQPGAGIRDCAGSLGTSGQVLASTGTALQWAGTGVPGWTSAGTLQSVGFGATTTAPVIGATTANNVSYRQLGPKEWEVVYVFTKTTNTGYTNGSGDYILTLPDNLEFDTTLPWQGASPGALGALGNSGYLFTLSLPGASVFNAYTTTGNGTGNQTGVIPFDTRRFRLIFSSTSIVGMWSSTYYRLNEPASVGFSTRIQFQFTSL